MPAISLNPKIQNFGLEFLQSLGRALPFRITWDVATGGRRLSQKSKDQQGLLRLSQFYR
jgi:hypothetical protein